MFDPYFDDDGTSDVAAPALRAALRIRGDAVDPEFITQQLGVAPTASARPGEPAADRDARSDGAAAATGLWAYELSLPGGTELGEAIDLLLARVPNDTTMWEELADAYAIDVHCVLSLTADASPYPTGIDADVLQRLARFRLPLSLELVVGAPADDDG